MRPISLLAVSTTATLLAVGTLQAQPSDSLSLPHPEFMERSYFFKNFPSDKTGEIFEGMLSFHLPFRQPLQGLYDQALRGPWESHHKWAIYFSMVTNLRMTQEASAPVRTPSYMPKLTATWFNVKRRQAGTLASGVSESLRMWAVPLVPYGHYSNGQDGCLFASQEAVGDSCVDTTTVQQPREANRRDGSFSSHYTQLGVFYRRIQLDPASQPGGYAVAQSYWSLGAQMREYYLYRNIPGGMTRELADVYGPLRVRALGHRVSQRNDRLFGPGQFRLEGFVELIHGGPPEVDPVRVSLEVARTMDKRSGWGVFLRGYHGQDDYNLGFLTNITVVQLGVTLSGERMPAFKL
jgi:hypothetical protein